MNPIAFQLGPYCQRFRQSILQTQANFGVSIVFACLEKVERYEPGCCNAGPGSRISCTDPPDDGKSIGQRQGSHQIEIETFYAGTSTKAARWCGVGGVAEPAQIVISTFYCEIAIELVAAEKLVAGTAVVLCHRIDSETTTGQGAADGVVVKVRLGGANVAADIKARRILCKNRRAGNSSKERKSQKA